MSEPEFPDYQCCIRSQDSGTAIWVIAYFGYWLEVIIVLTSRAIRGSLLSAKKGNQKCTELPLGVKGVAQFDSGSDSPTTARANQKAAGERPSPGKRLLTATKRCGVLICTLLFLA